ncbi:FkbM family methyltransferase [Methylomonas sp. 2BW1-5-20]|uniref:FkbM family methyltransferase n=1 Tax=Methylomonas sp. 2BW1-5-20 TaxID=3376686 RepID=UPI00404E0E85
MHNKLKLFAQKIIDTAFSWFLWKISESAQLKVFRMAARRLNVLSYTCSGELGTYEGYIEDKWVFPGYLFNRTWEPVLQEILSDHIFQKGHGTYIDIGANIGLTSIPLAIKKDISIYSFEPEPNNYLLLHKNIAANSVESKVTAINCALYSEQATLDFELSNENLGDHRIRAFSSLQQKNVYGETGRRVIKVKAEKLDTILDPKNLLSPIVIKLDTQGAELQVLKGAEHFLKKVDYLILEFWPYGLLQLGCCPDELIKVVQQFPYGAIYERNQDSTNFAPCLIPVNKIIEEMKNMIDDNTKIDTPMQTKDMDIIFSRHPHLSN